MTAKVNKKVNLKESKFIGWQPISYKACKYQPFAVTKNLLHSACFINSMFYISATAEIWFLRKGFIRNCDITLGLDLIFGLYFGVTRVKP